MVNRIGLLVLVLTLCTSAFSRYAEKDSNIVISQAKEIHEFVFNKKNGNVEVKQSLSTVYSCNSFRTSLYVVEMYDDQATIDNVDFAVDGKKPKDIKPVFEYYSVDNIFFSDTRVCYFELPLQKKGSTSEVRFEKTITDPRYFTSIFFTEPYNIIKKEVTVKVPRWMKVELKEMNFKGYNITKTATYDSREDADIFTYTISDAPATVRERYSPGPTYIYPHLLVMTKSATPSGNSLTFFNTLNDQYGWYRSLVRDVKNDEGTLKAKAQEITKSYTTDLDKIKAVFYWVQNNIRYIAFEDGIAGFRPDKAHEVLRKKYGDCKGMAHLTKELLRSLGYDARLTWIGTNHIAHDYSTPNLSVDNHMICALNFEGKTYFLDATETYIGFNEYAERIQGRQVLVEDGDKFILTKVPATTHQQNLDFERRKLVISGTDLQGSAEHEWKGEEKEYILTQLNSIKKDKSKEAFMKYLSEDNKDYALTDFSTSSLDDFDKSLTAKYNLTFRNAVSSFGKEYYVDMDFRKELSNFTFEIAERTHDYWFSYKQNLQRETELTIPEGYMVTHLPENVEIKNAGYEFTIKYTQQKGKLVYQKSIIIKNPRLSKASFAQWNKDIEQLNQAYNEQVVLTAK
jgi:transglutaminase-like putative cysteine protease